MTTWTCFNGHVNDDSNNGCYVLSCPYAKPLPGIEAAALFSWLVAIFAGPVYPIAGGLAWAAMAVINGGGYMLGLPGTARWVAMAFAALVVFWSSLGLERRAGNSTSYRIVRDGARVVAMVAGVVWLIGHAEEYGLPALEIVGIMFATPFLFIAFRRMDRVLNVGVSRRRWDLPDWLDEFIHASNWRSAVVIGFGGGFLGFALGRDARVIAGLALWIIVTLGIMMVSGGLVLLRNSASAGKVLLGVVVGAIVGSFLGPLGFLIGAVGGGYLAGRWDARGFSLRKRKRSVYD